MASRRKNWVLFAISAGSVASLIPLLWLMQTHVSDPDPSDLNNWWLVFGFSAQALFAGRLIVQWIATEKHRRSVVPTSFWWLSLLGGLMLLVYFWRRSDPVGIAGQLFGNVVYVRNLYFLYAERRRAGVVGATARALAGDPPRHAPSLEIDAAHPARSVQGLVAPAAAREATLGAPEAPLGRGPSTEREVSGRDQSPGSAALVDRPALPGHTSHQGRTACHGSASARIAQSRQRQ